MPSEAGLSTLIERLQGKETLELEFKRSQIKLSKDVWSTISAFANTVGGWILLGVDASGDPPYEILGVIDPEAQVKDLYDQLNSPEKISSPVCDHSDVRIETLGGNSVIVIRVTAASRKSRPVYIGGNPYKGTYVRRQSGDYLAKIPEVKRMIRDASDETADSHVIPELGIEDLDPETVQNYRARFQNAAPGHLWNGYDTDRFLRAIEAFRVGDQPSQSGPTVAGLLLLGRRERIREWRSRHLIDFRIIGSDPEERWADRLLCEGNLLSAFEAIYPRLVQGQPAQFRLTEATRVEEGPLQEALREALVNLLVHADYAEDQASLIKRSDEGYVFRNPGSSRVPIEDLYSGDRSDPRNPSLVRMFRHIGLAEEAGTGLTRIISIWRNQGLDLPKIYTGSERYEFSIELRYAHLLSEEDREWLQDLGDSWTEPQQVALVVARHETRVDNQTLRRMTGLHRTDVTKVLGGLRDLELLELAGSGRGAYYVLGKALLTPTQPDLFGPDIGDNIDDYQTALDDNYDDSAYHPLTEERPRNRVRPEELNSIICALCLNRPLSMRQLSEITEKSRSHLHVVVRRLLANGSLLYEMPGNPSHPAQRYIAPRPPVELD